MPTIYSLLQEQQFQEKINALLPEIPAYMEDYSMFLTKSGSKYSSQYVYITNILQFLKFERDMIPECNDLDVKEIPVFIFNKLTETDLAKYQEHLRARVMSKAAIHGHFVALQSFYKFLNRNMNIRNNPFLFFDIPKQPAKPVMVFMESSLQDKLLSGILKNDKYLATTENGTRVLPVPHKVWLRRERVVLRNYAICALFLDTGMTVSELIGLDVSDVNTDQGYVVVHGKTSNKTKRVLLPEQALQALRTYINGKPLSSTLLDNYMFPDNDIFEWCQQHILDQNLDQHMKQEFPDKEDTFYDGLRTLIGELRRHGRKNLAKPGEKALFVSYRGSRMSVRMLEYMIKEMIQTYLPDFDDKDLFTPNRLRRASETAGS